jgi:predicted MPP superfamily phosphohydrolase
LGGVFFLIQIQTNQMKRYSVFVRTEKISKKYKKLKILFFCDIIFQNFYTKKKTTQFIQSKRNIAQLCKN